MYGAMHGVHMCYHKNTVCNEMQTRNFSLILLQDFNCTLVKLNTILFRLLTCSGHNTVYLKY